ncbi:MAG: MarR family transcriptional regulator [Eubacteriales bacterium]|nr:MarR family transcriptional regulator [Eubacteriales bacterium]
MQKSYHYFMLMNHTLFQKQAFEQLADTPLSIGQPKVLDFLYEHDGCMQKEIAEGCLLEPASVTSLLSRMEREELIRRTAKDGDRRSLYVFLTPYGKEMAERVRHAMHEIESRALSGFRPDEQDVLMQFLEKIHSNLCTQPNDNFS